MQVLLFYDQVHMHCIAYNHIELFHFQVTTGGKKEHITSLGIVLLTL